MFNFLIASVDSKAVADSVKTVLLDTTGKTDLEKGFISTINEAVNTPPDQLISALGEKALQFGMRLLAAIAIYFIGAWLIKLARNFLRGFFARKNTEPAIVSFTMSLVTAMLWVLLIIITVGALGLETTSLAALLAAGGMAIGMALSGTVQNFAGGVMILIFKPFKAGDFIEAMGYSGTVSEVSITATKILTPDNKVIILPNGPLQGGTINNYSKMHFRRVDFTVSVEYDSDADVVKNTLLEIASSDARIMTRKQGAPADPLAALSELGLNSVDFVFKVWVKTEDYWDVFYATNEKIYKSLPERGIKFPFSQISVHME